MKDKVSKKSRIVLTILAAVLALLVCGAVIGTVCVNKYLDKIKKIDNDNIEIIPPEDEIFETDLPPEEWSTPDETTVLFSDETSAAEDITSESADITTPEDTTSEPADETTANSPESDTLPVETTAAVMTSAATTAAESIVMTPTETKPATDRQSTSTTIILPYENVLPKDIKLTPVDSLDDEGLLNIMIVGQDAGAAGKRTRTDSMMLLSINKDTGRISLVSFLRDLYVQIPGYSDNRLNTPYLFGGFPLLYKAMEVNFGIHVDCGFVIDFDGFKKVIDVLGGVDIELTAAEAKYMKLGTERAIYHMDGATALSYSRIRHLDSDFGRANRQRNVMYAIYEMVQKMSLVDLLKLVDTIMPYMQTDMDNSKMLSTITSCYKLLGNELYTYKIPAQDAFSFAYVRGMAVILPNLPKNRAYLQYYLGLK